MPTIKDLATSQAVRAGIRGAAQFVVSAIISAVVALPLVAQLGIEDLLLEALNEDQLTFMVSAAVYGAWVGLINRLEARWPALGYLNIIPGAAQYDSPALG